MFCSTSSALTHTWAGNGDGTDEAGPNRLGPLVHVNNFAMVEFNWGAGEVRVTLNKAEKTQMQRDQDAASSQAIKNLRSHFLSEMVACDYFTGERAAGDCGAD